MDTDSSSFSTEEELYNTNAKLIPWKIFAQEVGEASIRFNIKPS